MQGKSQFRARSFDKSTIQDINRVEASFSDWGQQFTYDCNKEKRRTHAKWFVRNMKHVARFFRDAHIGHGNIMRSIVY